MFLAKYSISNKVLGYIVRMEVDLFYLKSIEIPVEWERRLKAEVVIKKVYGGAKLLDIPLGVDVISKIVMDEPDRDEKIVDIAKRLGLTVKERDLQMVFNLINTNKLVDQISYISSKFVQEKVTLKELLQINKLVGERMVPVDSLGVFRMGNVNENNLIVYPPTIEIPYQMDDFMSWFENTDSTKVHPVIKFSITMGELIRLVPFDNFNLVSALFFSLASLGAAGYGIAQFSIEEELYRTKESLKEVIVNYEKSGWDLTGVIEYFAGVLHVCVSKAKVRVSNVEGVSVKYRSGTGRAVALSERQLVIMEELTIKNEMTIKQIREILPLVSDDTILRDLKSLVNKRMIRKRGKTKGAVYVLGKVKSL